MTRIIAITGGSGAGKTTLARALGRRLGAVVVAEDDYYHCTRTIAGFDAATYNFDTPLAKDHALLLQHVMAARAGTAFDKPVYDLASHRRSAEQKRIAPGPCLIVEGIHLLAVPNLREAFDFGVFIDADEALRLGRRMIRDVEVRGRTPRAVMAQFFASVRPMHEAHVEPQRALADLVITSTHESGPDSAEADAACIAAALGARA